MDLTIRHMQECMFLGIKAQSIRTAVSTPFSDRGAFETAHGHDWQAGHLLTSAQRQLGALRPGRTAWEKSTK